MIYALTFWVILLFVADYGSTKRIEKLEQEVKQLKCEVRSLKERGFNGKDKTR